MTTTETDTIADLLVLKNKCLDRIAHQQQQMDHEQQQVGAIETVMRMIRPSAEPEQLRLDDLVFHQPDAPCEDQPGWASKPSVDLSGAKNLLSRIIILAKAWGGVLDAMDVAQYLICHGYSTSTPKNLRPHVYNAMTDCPDFVKIGQGTFQYLPESGDFMTVKGCESDMTTL